MGYKNYSKISNNQKIIREPIHVDQQEPSDNEQNVYKAEVVDCLKLYVREQPNPDANPLCIVEVGAKLNIEAGGNDTFYKVITDDNTIGYCMKKYIKIV